MRRARPRLSVRGFALLALWLAAAPGAAGQTVRAEDYDAFWVWAGVAPQPLLAGAKTIYILQGQVEAGDTGAAADLRDADARHDRPCF